MKPIKILFIPVSSTSGVGEYLRSTIIAEHLQQQYPTAEINFILNKNACYAQECQFTTHLCNSSGTKNTPYVKKIIDQLHPNLVIFDCSGRGKQFKYAKSRGAKVIFISQHKRKRAKGLHLGRLLNMDIHWVVQPPFAMPPLSLFQQIKLKLFQLPPPKNIGAIFSKVNLEKQNYLLAQLKLEKNSFFLFNAGSGGHKIKNELAADIYYEAAKKFHQSTGLTCVMLFGTNYPKSLPPSTNHIKTINSINNHDFIALLDAAKGRVISGGDTLLQTLELKKPSVAAAVSKDQPNRLSSCCRRNIVIKARFNADDLAKKAELLLDEKTYQAILQQMQHLQPLSAIDIALDDIKFLLKNVL